MYSQPFGVALIAAIGDFTKSLVNDPPTHIWTRELKVSYELILTLVRTNRTIAGWCLEHIQAVQSGYTYLYGNRYWRRIGDVHPVSFLVSESISRRFDDQSYLSPGTSSGLVRIGHTSE